MTSKDREDDNRSAATIVETDFLVRFIVSGVFTTRLLEERCDDDDDETKKNFKQMTTPSVLLYPSSSRSTRVPVFA